MMMILSSLLKACLILLSTPAKPNNSQSGSFDAFSASIPSSTSSSSFFQAEQALQKDDLDTAFSILVEAHSENPNQPGILSLFQEVFERRLELQNNAMDRMGLGSIFLEMEKFGLAATQLEQAMKLDPTMSYNVAPMLFQARAAICDWRSINEDGDFLSKSIQSSLLAGQVPAVHPYKALMWPCLSLKDASSIATKYAERAQLSVPTTTTATTAPPPDDTTLSTFESAHTTVPDHNIRQFPASDTILRRIRLGYLSPDFTGRHPLAFLMQDVFRFHNQTEFEVFVYSMAQFDGSSEVTKIRESAEHWQILPTIPTKAASIIRNDCLDILVDLCGYTGTSLIAETMAQQPAPIQVAYMGFPGSSGSQFINYLICDQIVVPPHLRHHYVEHLIYMPHSYFVNSHHYLPTAKPSAPPSTSTTISTPTAFRRQDYDLPETSFVYCCHSRPEKIDPTSFRTWLRALQYVPNSVLWLLRSGPEMEYNLRQIACQEFNLETGRLVFCNKAPRDEHLSRLALADLFLDSPAYNAHTVGCDCLHAGVPMVSLLRNAPAPSSPSSLDVETEKFASRVGASLLEAVGLPELIVPIMAEYEQVMVRSALDRQWFTMLKQRLSKSVLSVKEVSPLFDTQRWVQNLESGLSEIAKNGNNKKKDVVICDIFERSSS